MEYCQPRYKACEVTVTYSLNLSCGRGIGLIALVKVYKLYGVS